MSPKLRGRGLSGLADKGNDAHRSLRAKLLTYGLVPYMQLNIRDLAESMGVSSTPIREALVRLADEGVIHFKPGRGFFTKPLNFEEIYADFEMEKMILRYSIAKSLQTFPVFDLALPERTDIMYLSSAALEEYAGQYSMFITNFHAKIALSSGNRRIQGAMSLCCDRLHRIRVIDFSEPSRLSYVVKGVSELLSSLARRNLDEVISLIDGLFDASISQIERVVKDGNARALQTFSGQPFSR